MGILELSFEKLGSGDNSYHLSSVYHGMNEHPQFTKGICLQKSRVTGKRGVSYLNLNSVGGFDSVQVWIAVFSSSTLL